MKLENVPVQVAINRMFIYAHTSTDDDKKYKQTRLLRGNTVTYAAYDANDKFIGRTRLEPEDFPVTMVTETTF